jgi:hypothetical protein
MRLNARTYSSFLLNILSTTQNSSLQIQEVKINNAKKNTETRRPMIVKYLKIQVRSQIFFIIHFSCNFNFKDGWLNFSRGSGVLKRFILMSSQISQNPADNINYCAIF